MNLSNQVLKANPHMYYLFLNDFIRERPFTVAATQTSVKFSYIGDPYKFYSPDSFDTSHDVHDAIEWMKRSVVHLKSDTLVFQLDHIVMPDDYSHIGSVEFDDVFYACAILHRITTGLTATPTDVVSIAKDLTYGKKLVTTGKNKTVELNINVNPETLQITTSDLFLPNLSTHISNACYMANMSNQTKWLTHYFSTDKYKIKLVAGGNRGISTVDCKLFEDRNGTYREIHLGHRFK